MALEWCAVEACVEFATRQLEMDFHLTAAETVRVVVPLCWEHDELLKEWKRRNVPREDTNAG